MPPAARRPARTTRATTAALLAAVAVACSALVSGLAGGSASGSAHGGTGHGSTPGGRSPGPADGVVVFEDARFVDDRGPHQAPPAVAEFDAADARQRRWPWIPAAVLGTVLDRAGLHSISPEMALTIEEQAGLLAANARRSTEALEAPLRTAVAAFYPAAHTNGAAPDAGLSAVASALEPGAAPLDALRHLRTTFELVLSTSRPVTVVAADTSAPDGSAAPDARSAAPGRDVTSAIGVVPPLGFLSLPYPVGAAWAPGGPHTTTGADDGSPMSSIDWSRGWPSWGADTTGDHVTAMHGGTVTVYSSCNVRVTNDNGWATNYYHLANVSVQTGQVVTAGTPLANYAGSQPQALCQGGSSTGPHVHVSLLGNGLQHAVDGVTINGWLVHAGRFSYDYDHSYMWYARNASKSYGYSPITRDDCRPSASPIVSAPAVASTVQLAVSAGALCPWEVTSGSAWITVSASGTGAGSAALLLAANVSAAPRTGTVVVGGIPVDVTQTGAVVRSVAPGGTPGVLSGRAPVRPAMPAVTGNRSTVPAAA